MFDKAYLCVPADSQIDDQNNFFTFNDGRPHRIRSGPNLYKIKAGTHSIIVTSGTGEQWSVNVKVGYLEFLTVKVDLNGRNICGVRYKVEDAPMGIGFGAMKLD